MLIRIFQFNSISIYFHHFFFALNSWHPHLNARKIALAFCIILFAAIVDDLFMIPSFFLSFLAQALAPELFILGVYVIM